MKQCPKCHAEIEENAKFCLYCMTLLEDKQELSSSKGNKRWVMMVVLAAIVLLCVIGGVLLLMGYYTPPAPGDQTSTSQGESAADDTNGGGGFFDRLWGGDQSTTTKPKGEGHSTAGGSSGTTGSLIVNGATTSTGSSAATSTSNVGGNTTTTTTTTKPSTTVPVTPRYEYVAATTTTVYPAGQDGFASLEDVIVITKVEYVEPSGHYVIPETIGGKKVGAIMPQAFSDASVSTAVKSVTLPATVRSVWNNAFKNCTNLKDLYIKSNIICIYTDSFPPKAQRNNTLTIHCKRECCDFNYYYYRNIAEQYDALYQEWNG